MDHSSRVFSSSFGTPIGPVEISVSNGRLTRVRLFGKGDAGAVGAVGAVGSSGVPDKADRALLKAAEAQFAQYFSGKRRQFELPLALEGTEFQKAIWGELSRVTFGETSSYGALALAVGKPAAARAVGGAVGSNPLPIVIGCHRVLSGDGRLTGYSGADGLSTKRWLLALEGIEYKV